MGDIQAAVLTTNANVSQRLAILRNQGIILSRKKANFIYNRIADENLETTRIRRKIMTVNDWIHVIAGFFIIISLVLGIWVSPYGFLFTAFVGLNLFQYGLTKYCPMGIVLKKLGVPEERA